MIDPIYSINLLEHVKESYKDLYRFNLLDEIFKNKFPRFYNEIIYLLTNNHHNYNLLERDINNDAFFKRL